MAGGRPRKTLNDLPENWKEKMLELAREGSSDIELRVYALGHISNELWYDLIDREPEFSKTVKECRELSRSWWTRQGRTGLHDGMNATTYVFNMTNRFGDEWKHKNDTNVSGTVTNVNANVEVTKEVAEAINAKIAKNYE